MCDGRKVSSLSICSIIDQKIQIKIKNCWVMDQIYLNQIETQAEWSAFIISVG